METVDVRKEVLEEVELLGQIGYFTGMRVDKETVPEGMHCYELRHGDDWGFPVSVEESVRVNYFGAVLFTEALELGNEKSLQFGYEDFLYTGEQMYLSQVIGGQEPEIFKDGKALAEFFKETFPMTEEEGQKLVDYMEGHGYVLGNMDGGMLRGDLCDEQDKVTWEPYTIDDAVDAVTEWNFELINETEAAVTNPFAKNGREQFVIKDFSYYTIQKYDFMQVKYSAEFKEIVKIRKAMSQQIMDASKWPMFDIRVSLFSEDKMLIHFGVDNMIMDAKSVINILNEWLFIGISKHHNYVSEHLLFRDFVLANLENKTSKKYLDDKNFWKKKISQFPACPNLPLCNKPENVKFQVFKRESGIISGDVWSKIKKLSKNKNVTLTNILLAVYAISISKVGGSRYFGLNITIDQRGQFGKNFDNVIGDFTGNILLAVKLDSVTDFWQFACDIQKELLEDMNHLAFSGVEFQRELSRFDEKKYLYGIPCVYTSTLGMENNKVLGAVVYNITQTPQVWLDHQIQEMNDGVYLNWDYLEELFSTETICLLKEEYLNILKLVAEEKNVEFFESIEYQEGIL